MDTGGSTTVLAMVWRTPCILIYIYMCVCVHVYVYHVLPRWLDFFWGRNYHQLTQDRCRVVGVFFPAAVGLVCG